MRHGAIFIAQSPDMASAAERYAQVFEQVRVVDTLGFEHVWFTEHHFSNYAYVVNPFLMTVHAAGLTRNVRFVQGVTILPWWHPLRLAEDIAITDVLTGGRLDVGVGRGYGPHEFTAFNLDSTQRRAMFDECLDILFKVWDERTITYPQGQFWPIQNVVTVLPRPLQEPHPQIWAAVQSADSLAQAVARDMIPVVVSWGGNRPAQADRDFMRDLRQTYDGLLAAQGKPFRGFASLEMVYVAETDAAAYAQLEHTYWMLRAAKAHRGGTEHIEGGAWRVEPYDGEPDLAHWRERVIFGSPQTVVTKLRALADEGITYVVGLFDVGGMRQADVLHSIELYGREVIPALNTVGDAPRLVGASRRP
jgi:alkanesulfonate monooxygenase SsuD/methylene tetrahydromethanopterin reductase-like flavin-dependent oxidoreductase (luciferase family)